MKASVFQRDGQFTVEDVPEPVPAAGEVVIDVNYCGICGTDLHLAHSARFPKGAVMGHEFVGRIAEVGPSVTGWQPGDRVAVNPFRPYGLCPVCREGRGYLCPTGVTAGLGTQPGGYADQVAAPAENLLALPDGLTFRQAAVIEPLAVALHAVLKAKPGLNDHVLIFGGGPIGLLVLQCVRLAGCRSVILSETVPLRRERTGAIGADHIFECAGVPATIRTGIVATKPGGCYTQVALPAHSIPLHLGAIIQREITLRGSMAYHDEFPLAIDFIARDRINVDNLVTAEVPLAGVTEAFAELTEPGNQQIKVLVKP